MDPVDADRRHGRLATIEPIVDVACRRVVFEKDAHELTHSVLDLEHESLLVVLELLLCFV